MVMAAVGTSSRESKKRLFASRVISVSCTSCVMTGKWSQGLVEADVPVMADAKQLDVHAAPVLDPALVGFAHGGDVRGQAIGNDGVFGA